jgi:hypothetical protein
MEKVCIVRGEGFRLSPWLRVYGFRWDREAKLWWQEVQIDESGKATIAPNEGAKLNVVHGNCDEIAAFFGSVLFKPKKISVSFE